MRCLLACVFLFVLPAAPALAADLKLDGNRPGAPCKVTVGPNDRFAQKQTLVVKAGERLENALVMDGDVIVQAGARVEDVVALRGNVIVEPGARVKGDVAAIGGNVKLLGDARVSGDTVAIGGRLEVAEAAYVGGDRTALSLVLTDDIVQSVLAKVLPRDQQCQVHVEG